MNQVYQFIAVVRDLVLAPIRAVLDPWRAMHGQIGDGLFQLSFAGIAALLTFLFLTVVIVVFAVTLGGDERTDFSIWLRNVMAMVIMTAVITVTVYYSVRFWLQEAGDRYADIEQAWKHGLEECRRNGFDLRRMPLFLILGSERSSKDQYLMAASELQFAVQNFPKGQGLPLRWYASDEAIFVVLSHIGCLSLMARTAARLTDKQRVEVPLQGPSERSSRVGVSATCWPTEDESSLDEDSGIHRQGPATQQKPISSVGVAQTMGADDSVEVDVLAHSGAPKKPRIKLTPLETQDIDLERRRLSYFCRLAVQSRRPFCAINGVMLQLPLNLILVDQTNGALAKQATLKRSCNACSSASLSSRS
jgi:hypothetical protein